MRKHFEERNRIWVTGDTRPLLLSSHYSVGEPWYQRFRKQIQAKRREMSYRGGRLLRAHSHIQIQELNEDRGGGVTIDLDERVTWVYRDGADYSVESRIITHQQRWIEHGGEWYLQSDMESGEGVSPARHRGMGGAKLFSSRGLSYQGDGPYHRIRALRYAELWWDSFNPSFTAFESDDCTNFVSQCLLAGNLRMTDGGNRAIGWWYKFPTNGTDANWSYSWSTANGLALWLTNRLGAQTITDPRNLKIGDVIFYDWQGNGKYGHSTIVVDFNAEGDPLVNAHTDPSYHRHYRYLDSRAWTSNTKYLFVHIPDSLS